MEHRRLLLISHHFPPDTAIGARRWEKLAHYAAERGLGLDVITHRDSATPPNDAERARLDRLPPGVRIFGVVAPPVALARAEQFAWRQLKRMRGRATPAPSVPSNTASATAPAASQAPAAARSIPFEEIRWGLTSPRGWMRCYWTWLDIAQARAWGDQVLPVADVVVRAGMGGKRAHVAVVTSGPPHMDHDAGRRVAERTRLPFVMDMRDPWSIVERLPEALATPLWSILARRYERQAVERAALVIANTELSCRNLQAVYPHRRGDIITVMNGADDEPLPSPRRGERFVVAHAGTVYLDRDPRALFQAAAMVIRKLGLTPAQFGLEFIGELEAVGGFPIRDVANQEGIAEYVVTGPSRPYAEAMQFMADAAILVTMSGNNITAIPAKTFECIRFDSWVLALSAPGSATELLLRGTEADVVAPTDAVGIAEVLERRYRMFSAGTYPVRVAQDARFSRTGQARILFDALAARLGHGGGGDAPGEQ